MLLTKFIQLPLDLVSLLRENSTIPSSSNFFSRTQSEWQKGKEKDGAKSK